jgi:methyl-accepting chemotaxis protein
MRLYPLLAAAAALAVAASPAAAQDRQDRRGAPPRGAESTALAQQVSQGSEQPDVILDVPNLSVEQITLEVDNLQVHIALDARLANLLKLTAGADASIDKVKLDIKGVQATATLVVRLDNVRAIIERTLQTLDNNPQLITQLLSTVDNTVNTVGGVANNTVGTVGGIAGTALRNGQLLNLAGSGLTAVSQTVNGAGQTVRTVRDRAGQLLEVVTDSAGRIVSSRRVSQ